MKQEHKTDAAINTYAGWRPILKPVGRLLVAAQLALALQPLSVLAQEAGSTPYNPLAQAQIQRLAELNQTIEMAKANRGKTPADQVSDKLVKAQELVAQLRSIHTPGKSEKHQQLKALLAEINTGAADVRAEFAATRADLVKKNLPAEILARHDEAVGQFEQRAGNFAQIIASAANDDERVQRLAEFFDKFPNKRKPGKFDPKKLPWSTPQPNKRMPAETQTAWYQNLYGDQKIRLAQAGGSIGPLQFTTMPEASQAPTTADLAETDEVQLTPEIRAKAKELGNNPVNIYNWVRNNIEWVPTAGAIQSAQDTLEKGRGNATDTASLLIALFRAANIPARYQWGTIDVGATEAQNWVGGVTRPEAALQLMNQGGIAARGLASAGRLATIRMEHVWVQAYVNWSPGRGARNSSSSQHPNSNARLNAWVPLDASFKQYSYSQAWNLAAAVPMDTQALITAARQGASVNEAEGSVQGINQSALQAHLLEYQSRIKNYVESSPGGTNTLVNDVIGKKITPQQVQALLPGTLAVTVVLGGSQSPMIPASAQHKFTYALYASQFDQSEGNALISYTEKISRLGGRRLSLAYVPASAADEDLIASYMPQAHADGSPIQATELPSSLPGYLIRLRPTIYLNGQVVAQATGSVQMGTDLYSSGGFTQLGDRGAWDITSEESNVAGNSTVIGISASGISPLQIARLRERVTESKARLQSYLAAPTDVGPLAAVSGESVTGDLLIATIWDWFATSENYNRLGQGQANMVEVPGLSYGLFHAAVNPIMSWGVIRKVTFPGVNLDIGHVRNLSWASDNDSAKWVQYNQLRGQVMSALEHSIPEQHFSDPSRCNSRFSPTNTPALPWCGEGVSAVKAIGIAAEAGQRVFTITRAVYSSSPSIVSTRLAALSESTRARIQQALDAGYEVTAHEAPIASSGWVGAGFILTDPATGAGAYLLEGGANGGWYSLVSNAAGALMLVTMLAGKLALAGLIPAFGIAVGYFVLVLGLLALVAYILAELHGGYDHSCGGISTCHSGDYIVKIAALVTMMALLTVGLSGNLVALGLALFMLYSFFKGR